MGWIHPAAQHQGADSHVDQREERKESAKRRHDVVEDRQQPQVFFVTAAAFGGLSLWGYTTKRDLTAMGSFLFMGLIGIIIASLVNLFVASTALQFAVSVIGVLIFAGLTAYDTQQIKEMYYVGDDGSVAGRKAVMGALRLYLDFINLFMLLLQLFGNRR